ncbi:MAG: hypothetical protein MUQ01_04240 [Flavobacteriaceae bacterium]|nr:hypothetical protein [Flavobacteriaceae bacterium]
MSTQKKVLILTYYWPPSGGSGVQRWMYFAKHLKSLGWEPIVVTVDKEKASYGVLDESLNQEVDGIRVIKTSTREPLQLYSRLTTGSKKKGIPQGEVKRKSVFGKLSAFIRGNFFIPDARIGWVPFALKAARKIVAKEQITTIITTGPPHSSHLIGLQLQKEFKVNWFADFRDPWSDVFYNKDLYRRSRAVSKDLKLELQVLQAAQGIITTVGGRLHESLIAKAPAQKFYALPNGFDSELMNRVTVEKNHHYLHVVYTGLLTHNQPYKGVFKILNDLSATQPIKLSLAGNIAPDIINEIKISFPKIDAIFHGYLSHKEAVGLMKSANLLINFIFIGAQTQMISGKILEYIATEIPILSIGNPDSEAAKFLEQGTAAVMLDQSNLKEMRLFIDTVISQKDTLHNEFPSLEKWSREALTKRLIEEILN